MNLGKPNHKRFALRVKLRRLHSLVFPVIGFRLTRWPFALARAKALDCIQRRMVGFLLSLTKSPTESPIDFFRRKQRAVSKVIGTGKWSEIWRSRISTWHTHVLRNSFNLSWCAKIVQHRTPAELADRRRNNASGRPGTRALPGFFSTRWWEAAERILSNHV